jgi:hypothetical protein
MSALGPELTPGQRTFQYCRDVSVCLSEQTLSTVRLESLHYHQMRVLFAPQTVSMAEMVSEFEPHLSSDSVALRTAAVVGLHQLAQLDVRLLSQNDIEVGGALDSFLFPGGVSRSLLKAHPPRLKNTPTYLPCCFFFLFLNPQPPPPLLDQTLPPLRQRTRETAATSALLALADAD